MKLFVKAVRFAAEKHSTQRRKNAAATPYINHPVEVAEVLSDLAGVEDEEVLVAAVLHDTLEDTDARPEELEALFGRKVLGWVLECTDDKSLERAERKRLQVERASGKSEAAKIIKMADKICNLRSVLMDPPADWDLKRCGEYFEWAGRVMAGLKGVNERLDRECDRVLQAGQAKYLE